MPLIRVYQTTQSINCDLSCHLRYCNREDDKNILDKVYKCVCILIAGISWKHQAFECPQISLFHFGGQTEKAHYFAGGKMYSPT